jgi:Domain of unknown function (DUF4878)
MYNDPNQPQQPYGQPPNGGVPPTQYVPPQQYGGQQPQYGGMPPQPGYGYPAPPPQKTSLRWLWITLGIVGGVLVLICGGCTLLSFMGIGLFGQVVNTVVGPTTAANAYYQNIENQNYAQAYTYLDTSSVTSSGQAINTQSAFITLAQAEDLAQGKVTSFSQTNISTASTNGVNTATVTMTVTRTGSTYTVQLQLREENGTWKIVGFDNI